MTQGLDVHLIGAGNSAGQAAMFFANHARTVTLVVRGDSLEKSMSHYLIEQVRGKSNIRVELRSEVKAAHGDDHLRALDILDRWRPDVLLSDIGMPGQDGYALIRKLRAREADLGFRLPAAALTAYVRPEDKAAALKAGFDEQVRKPVAPAELARAIQRLLGRAGIN